MQFERKALYNLLRMNWLRDSSIEVEDWQVEDYRKLSLEELFAELEDLGLVLDVHSFAAYAEEYDSPEDLTDALTDFEEVEEQDHIYLIVFELWRRLTPEHRCLSIFCDELDYQINLYDRGELEEEEHLQDVLANLAVVLDEGTDDGAEPMELFASISSSCANDLESFIYDFTSEHIANEDFSYASELIDTFYDYVRDVKWFDFLRARATMSSDGDAANEVLLQIFEDTVEETDLELDLEMMSFLVQGGDRELFYGLLQRVVRLAEVEGDFQDVLCICADFFSCLDQEAQEVAIQEIITRREHLADDEKLDKRDPDIQALLTIFEEARSSQLI